MDGMGEMDIMDIVSKRYHSPCPFHFVHSVHFVH